MKNTIVNDISTHSIYEIYTPTISTLPFSVTGAGHFFANSGYRVERNNLNMYLLVYVCNGSGHLTYNERTEVVESGQIFVLDGGKYHHFHTLGEETTWEFKWIRFIGRSAVFFEEYINNDSLTLVRSTDFIIEECIDAVLSLIRSGQTIKDITLSHYVSSALTHCCNLKTELIQQSPKSNALVKAAKEYLEKNFTHDISIEALAKSLYVNHYTLIRQFKKQLSISPYAYLINIRVHHSKHMLEKTQMSVNEISEAIGFNNVNNYIYNFKKLTKTTPKQYRNLFR